VRAALRRYLQQSVQHWRRTLVTLAPIVLALLHSGGTLHWETIDKLEAMVYDARLTAFMPRDTDDRIVIVDIDEKSLAEVGRWPWNRQHMSHLIQRLFDEQQIAVLGMDVVFAEADESSGLTHLKALSKGALRDDSGLARQMPQLEQELDYDQRFALALQDKPVVLGYYFTSDRGGRKSGALPAPVFDETSLQGRRFVSTEWSGYGSNIPKIAQGAPVAGFFNPVVDADGVVRSLPLLAKHEGAYYESLALAMFRTFMGQPQVLPGFAPGSESTGYPYLESVLLSQDGRSMAIPVDERVATLVPFRGNGGPQGGSYTYISASDVLTGQLPPGMLQDRLVLLGTTAPGLLDMRATPVAEVYPGVETHANILSALLDGNLPVRPDYAQGYEWLLLLLSGLVLALLAPTLNALRTVVLAGLLTGGLVGLNLWLYTGFGLVLPLATLVLAVLLASALNMAYGYFVESRSKRELAHLFGSYVPPELVDEMVKEPERYSMQASDKVLTVMFSDMRGFTHLSESMEPAQLQALLNHVFTRLTQAIRERRGTIDKYMGDCVMAFWGAPVETPGHAALAVEAALAMGQAIADINLEHDQKQLPRIGMGVGLNTGLMCVGDMGSELRRSYTVIGDAVNLGSRLEGVSKFYGVEIVASDATRQQAGEGFIWQELDKVKVKGKDEAVTIHTVRGVQTDLTPALAQELAMWEHALNAWRAQNWDQAIADLDALLQLYPHKALYHLYHDRVKGRLGQPPDPAWDGSTQFETK
jgi:adenylate cyclase